MAHLLERGPAHPRARLRHRAVTDLRWHVEQLLPPAAGNQRSDALPADRRPLELERAGPGFQRLADLVYPGDHRLAPVHHPADHWLPAPAALLAERVNVWQFKGINLSSGVHLHGKTHERDAKPIWPAPCPAPDENTGLQGGITMEHKHQLVSAPLASLSRRRFLTRTTAGAATIAGMAALAPVTPVFASSLQTLSPSLSQLDGRDHGLVLGHDLSTLQQLENAGR